MELGVQQSGDAVVIIEYDDGQRYEVAQWTDADFERNPTLREVAENAERLVEEDPTELIYRIHGSVDRWHRIRDSKKRERVA